MCNHGDKYSVLILQKYRSFLACHGSDEYTRLIVYSSGSQSVLCRSQGFHNQFPQFLGDPWVHFYFGYSEVHIFFLN